LEWTRLVQDFWGEDQKAGRRRRDLTRRRGEEQTEGTEGNEANEEELNTKRRGVKHEDTKGTKSTKKG
jgi:hypothetical protein